MSITEISTFEVDRDFEQIQSVLPPDLYICEKTWTKPGRVQRVGCPALCGILEANDDHSG